MSQETISFSEELIPEVVEIIRMGRVRALKWADGGGDRKKIMKMKRASHALEEQCELLLAYWNRMQEEDDG